VKIGDLADLPPTLTTAEAAEVYGCGTDHLWALVRSDESPIRPLHLGRKLVWPTALVLKSIGLEPVAEADTPATVTPLRLADG
jgi:hypothetical protein